MKESAKSLSAMIDDLEQKLNDKFDTAFATLDKYVGDRKAIEEWLEDCITWHREVSVQADHSEGPTVTAKMNMAACIAYRRALKALREGKPGPLPVGLATRREILMRKFGPVTKLKTGAKWIKVSGYVENRLREIDSWPTCNNCGGSGTVNHGPWKGGFCIQCQGLGRVNPTLPNERR